MNNNDDSSFAPVMMFGGVVLACFFATMMVKAIKVFFTELGLAFAAFGKMTGSFIFMLWNLSQVVFLIALIIMSVVCAIYFTIQYYRMIKQATDLQNFVKHSVWDLESETKSKMDRLEKNVKFEISKLSAVVTAALEKPELAPESLPPSRTSSSEKTSDQESTGNADLGISTDSAGSMKEEDTDDESITMSNPY